MRDFLVNCELGAQVLPQSVTIPETLSCGKAELENQQPDKFPCPSAIPLRGVVQHYAWGKCAQTSIVAAMATEQVRSKRGPTRAPPLSRGNRFAELWMGTHGNGPSSVLLPDEDTGEIVEMFLQDVIEQDPVFWLGEDAECKGIPYLFKVLAVRQALSIQAHPNKQLAEQLHREQPAHYPDGNHKPEICIPLGHFEALCGFRPVEQVRKHVCEVNELRHILELNSEIDLHTANLRQMFSSLMKANQNEVQKQVVALTERLNASSDRSADEDLIVRIAQDYPGDVGIFAVYFLNYVVVPADAPNKFIYCAPDEPHAYLLGDAVECMAMSDNVVRAGLTLKHKDVDTLLGMMSYRDDLLNELVGQGERIAPHVVRYNPPVDDFMVYEVDGPASKPIHLPHAAITACLAGAFSLEFRVAGDCESVEAEDMIGEKCFSCKSGHGESACRSASPAGGTGPRRVEMGHTFFSRAGTDLVIVSAEGKGRLFIATY